MLALGSGECKLRSAPETRGPLRGISPSGIGPGPESFSHEARVPLEVIDGHEGAAAPGDLEHGGVDAGTGVEGSGREPAAAAEAPPRSPDRAQEIERRSVVDAGAVAGDLPL